MSQAESTVDFGSEWDLTTEDLELVGVYSEVGVPADQLAYTPQFDTLFARIQAKGDRRSKAELFRRLLNLRKSGQLPLLGRRTAG